MENKTFGIDLGTTNSAIAIFENDEARILKNVEGYEITPSVVFFDEVDSGGNDVTVVGDQAKNAAATAPDKVKQFVKRDMGKKGSIYNFVAPSGKEYTPEEISALILKKVCKGAEQFVGEGNVRNVVITVPAYFDDARRTATKQAGKIAGLNVVRVINEPTAAAIAFGLDTSQNGKVLVYDLGGGTFDVTVMQINDGNYDVIATGGDHELGGINFDQKILALILKNLQEQGCKIDDEDDALMAELREKSEKTKIQLTNIESARQRFTINGSTYRVEVTREAFEQESESLMQQTEQLLSEVMSKNGISWSEIDHLLVVGGSTRMPMVKKLLERLSGKEVTYKVDPDTAVALGASIFASTLSLDEDLRADPTSTALEQYSGVANKIVVSDVTSQSLGVITIDRDNHDKKVNTIIIPHNSKIPAKRSEIVYTICDNQRKVDISVTEGNDSDVDYVKIIGGRVLDIPPYPKNSPIEVVYAYDADQTIYIEVIDKVGNQSLGTFEIDRESNLSEEDVVNATAVIGRMWVD